MSRKVARFVHWKIIIFKILHIICQQNIKIVNHFWDRILFVTDNIFKSHPKRSKRSMEHWENEITQVRDGTQNSKVPVNQGTVEGILLCSSTNIAMAGFQHEVIGNSSSLLYKFNYEDGSNAHIKIRKF